ncbi:MAG: hypothetical protein Q8O62_04465 [Aequorivita sp.]|nr:hypothetical protein [Aequorivita sp.]
MACNSKITQNILFDACNDAPKKGLSGSKGVIINYDDIDFTSTTSSGSTVTTLTLKNGTSGFSVAWYKQLGSYAGEFAKNDEAIDGFTNSFLTRLGTSSAENAERANELKSGKFIMVVETEYKGASNLDAYKVIGFQAGLELSEMTTSSNENSGSILFTLASPTDTFEQYPFMVLNEGSFSATTASYAALFAEV